MQPLWLMVLSYGLWFFLGCPQNHSNLIYWRRRKKIGKKSKSYLSCCCQDTTNSFILSQEQTSWKMKTDIWTEPSGSMALCLWLIPHSPEPFPIVQLTPNPWLCPRRGLCGQALYTHPILTLAYLRCALYQKAGFCWLWKAFQAQSDYKPGKNLDDLLFYGWRN